MSNLTKINKTQFQQNLEFYGGDLELAVNTK
jgi:hypothetical protein